LTHTEDKTAANFKYFWEESFEFWIEEVRAEPDSTMRIIGENKDPLLKGQSKKACIGHF
jgi:hypothetical protein